jgi:hypothetical protein
MVAGRWRRITAGQTPNRSAISSIVPPSRRNAEISARCSEEKEIADGPGRRRSRVAGTAGFLALLGQRWRVMAGEIPIMPIRRLGGLQKSQHKVSDFRDLAQLPRRTRRKFGRTPQI